MIIEVPIATPETTPEADPTVATPVLLLLHVPPVTASVSVVVEPVQSVTVPRMAVGVGFTVTTKVAEQLVPEIE